MKAAVTSTASRRSRGACGGTATRFKRTPAMSAAAIASMKPDIRRLLHARLATPPQLWSSQPVVGTSQCAKQRIFVTGTGRQSKLVHHRWKDEFERLFGPRRR